MAILPVFMESEYYSVIKYSFNSFEYSFNTPIKDRGIISYGKLAQSNVAQPRTKWCTLICLKPESMLKFIVIPPIFGI